MTGPAGIGSAAAAPGAGAAARLAEAAPDDTARAEAGEFAAFAELFSFMEGGDGAAAETGADGDGKDKRSEADDKAPPILLAEMTHYQWFGGPFAMPVDTSGKSTENPTTDSGGLANALLGVDLPEPVRELLARSAAMRSAQTAATPTGLLAPVNSAAAETPPPPDVAGGRLQPPAPPASAESTRPAATASEASRRREPLAADMKTNLLALETMLSQNGAAGKDSMDRGAETPFTPPPFKEVRISSIKQETHFASGMIQSPIMQIAGHIDQGLRSTAIAAVQQPSDDPRPEMGPVRVLHIQLDPPQLGPLTIRIAMKDGALHLQLETARHETASLIQTDKDALTGVLRSAGYVVDGLNVQVAAPDRPPAQQFAGSGGGGFNQAAGQQSGSQQSGGRGGQAPPADGMGDASAGSSHDTQGPQAVEPRGGSVYL
jgi:flagellar hook-length control protein FliK